MIHLGAPIEPVGLLQLIDRGQCSIGIFWNHDPAPGPSPRTRPAGASREPPRHWATNPRSPGRFRLENEAGSLGLRVKPRHDRRFLTLEPSPCLDRPRTSRPPPTRRIRLSRRTARTAAATLAVARRPRGSRPTYRPARLVTSDRRCQSRSPPAADGRPASKISAVRDARCPLEPGQPLNRISILVNACPLRDDVPSRLVLENHRPTAMLHNACSSRTIRQAS